MGIPTLTKENNSFLFRCGESINYNVNSEELIAKNEKEYFDKALNIQKANNINLNYRHALREKVLKSNQHLLHYTEKNRSPQIQKLYSTVMSLMG